MARPGRFSFLLEDEGRKLLLLDPPPPLLLKFDDVPFRGVVGDALPTLRSSEAAAAAPPPPALFWAPPVGDEALPTLPLPTLLPPFWELDLLGAWRWLLLRRASH